MAIRKLSPLLINQIAAGEVIERPASVVKELVENALDAGARRISVHLEDGGRELIRVADDGGGIAEDELPLAIESHATSKISSAEELAAVPTLGFRGEALASIASVSRLRLTSRPPEADAGAVLEIAGDERQPIRPTSCAPGTVVEVRNLFFNTPARRKFMRTAGTEFGHVNEALSRIALAHPAVGFKLVHKQRVTFDLPPDQPPVRRVLDQLGGDLEEGLLEFASDERGVRLWGMAGLPALARSTARHQYVYVNGRPVRDRHIGHALREAYRGLIEPNQQPTIVLFVAIDPATVDVNVHPAKAEVRFADGNAVHGQVLSVVRQRLLAADLTPSVNVRNPEAASHPTATDAADSTGQEPGGIAAGEGMGITSAQLDQLFGAGRTAGPTAGASAPDAAFPWAEDAPVDADEQENVSRFVDYFRRMDPRQKGFVYQQVRQEMQEEAGEADFGSGNVGNGGGNGGGGGGGLPILQVHDSYIVTQDEQGLLIIDQHALHERMMFESFQRRMRSRGSLETQRLITPATVAATPARLDALQRLEPLLQRIGIEAEPSGPATIAVHAFPTLLFDRNVDPVEFVDDLLDRADEAGLEPDDEQALHEVLDMMSCKAAVKAGDALKLEELRELLASRERFQRVASCPHGRPTTIRLTVSELEKHFKRS